MKTIWKYNLEITDEQFINIPEGAEILTIQIQKGKPVLWGLVNDKDKNETRKIRIFGTGIPIITDWSLKYIGTYQLLNGDLIGHVFEEIIK